MRILVVEDDADLLAGLSQALRESGYAVDQADEGNSALALAKAGSYDAIILDIMLPHLNGREILTQLRHTRSTPVLFLTACDTIDDRVEGLDLGADDYLVKPFDLAELLARVRAMIRRHHDVRDPVIRMGDLAIDTNARLVSKDGVPIELTAREYALVELLAMKRGGLVTRTFIYDHLFDDNHDSMSNLVDVYISRIRSKLGKDFVKTRRGEGYFVGN
ncbi:response regulator transcription factor [Rhodopirellula sallentina]|uniref:Two component heavy metal response winged helix family transcriptional regulator n=1 Tax=Rhodopirellula sallentina SM41 TaxID=1263870 RepID=M5U8J7_9BACT|nr:response regulator transcription factor [Rhodopirellula sallentina]EMI57604.1 two component heavy metal response winged helix family transcriptional regulator [Rhodopirellula sallentina SM41]